MEFYLNIQEELSRAMSEGLLTFDAEEKLEFAKFVKTVSSRPENGKN